MLAPQRSKQSQLCMSVVWKVAEHLNAGNDLLSFYSDLFCGSYRHTNPKAYTGERLVPSKSHLENALDERKPEGKGVGVKEGTHSTSYGGIQSSTHRLQDAYRLT